MQYLVRDYGADVNHADHRGFTPLLAAAHSKQAVCAKWLVNASANINHTNHNGDTALMLAAQGDQPALTKWLVKAGADPQAVNEDQENAADISRAVHASPEQTAYLKAKAHCANAGCSGAGTKKCQGCMHGRYCGPACHVAHWPAHRAECRRLGAMLMSAQEEGGE
jgi:ankyrin repeat protein